MIPSQNCKVVNITFIQKLVSVKLKFCFRYSEIDVFGIFAFVAGGHTHRYIKCEKTESRRTVTRKSTLKKDSFLVFVFFFSIVNNTAFDCRK